MQRLALALALTVVSTVAALAQGAARITLDDFRRVHAAKTVLVVDVRDPQAFANGHVPGAINIQLGTEQQPESLAMLKAAGKRPIVTYCA